MYIWESMLYAHTCTHSILSILDSSNLKLTIYLTSDLGIDRHCNVNNNVILAVKYVPV